MSAFIFPPFENVNGRLSLDDVYVGSLMERFGSPLIVVSEKQIRENYRKLDQAFRGLYPNFSVRYAIKSYPNLSVVSILRQEGSGADCSTPGEIEIANKAGIPYNMISFTPNNASVNELLYGIERGVTINFDDISQMRLVADHMPDVVSFRVNPGVGRGEFPGVVTAGPGTKFGIPENAVKKAYREAIENGAIRFGMHMMAGSNSTDWEKICSTTEAFFNIAGSVSQELGIQFSFLDIGGGFGVPYRPGDGDLDLEKTAGGVIANLKEACSRYGMEEPELIVEPGRFIVANSALLLGKVTNVKDYDKTFVGTDIGMNLLLRPALYGSYHHIVIANDLNREPSGVVDIVGQICESTDKIAKDLMFPKAEDGDIVAVFNAGSYVSAMSSNYNGHPRPAEILIRDGKSFLIKESETTSDLMRGMHVPDHLTV